MHAFSKRCPTRYIIHLSFYKIVMQVQIDVLSVVSNVQQVPPEELIASQEKTESSTRCAFTVAIHMSVLYASICKVCKHICTRYINLFC